MSTFHCAPQHPQDPLRASISVYAVRAGHAVVRAGGRAIPLIDVLPPVGKGL
jgi:hypothetical protein